VLCSSARVWIVCEAPWTLTNFGSWYQLTALGSLLQHACVPRYRARPDHDRECGGHGRSYGLPGTLVSARFVGREKIFTLVCSVLSALPLVVFIHSRRMALTVIPLYLITLLTMFAFTAILTLPYSCWHRYTPAQAIKLYEDAGFTTIRIFKEFTQEPASPSDPIAKDTVFSVLGQRP
jgi:hypothetical protein